MLDRQQRLAAFSRDRALAARVLFKARHGQPSPPFHVVILDAWRSRDPIVLIEAARGSAKSTLAEEFLLLEALFGNMHYGLIFGETYSKACQRLEAMRHQALTNRSLHALFGHDFLTHHNESALYFKGGIKLEAIGWEQEVRAYKHLDHRPDRALLDDVENRERVRDTAAVERTWSKLFTELIPAMEDAVDEQGAALARIRIIGTPLARDCLVTRLRDSPDVTHLSFAVCDGPIDHPETKALWPERRPMSWIRARRDTFQRAGLLRQFLQEYMLEAAPRATRLFQREQIQYVATAHSFPPRVAIIDPARTVGAQSAATGWVVVSRETSAIMVHESGAELLRPDAVIALAFRLQRDHHLARLAIERNSLDEWLLQPLRAEMLRRGETLPLQGLLAPRDKLSFIGGLQPFFAAGDVRLVGSAAHARLEEQILAFPEGARLDALNALAYAPLLLGGDPVYPDFSEAHVLREPRTPAGAQWLLALGASAHDTAAALLALDPPRLLVLADWLLALPPTEGVAQIVPAARLCARQRPLQAYVPAEQMDQALTHPVQGALRRAGLTAQRGDYAAGARGCLASALRTTYGGQRALAVASTCFHTIAAFSLGYAWPAGSLGPRAVPVDNAQRRLIEAIECAWSACTRMPRPGQLPEGAHAGENAQGVPYLTALPRRG